MSLKGAFEIASTYVLLKRGGGLMEEEAQILERTYLDALEYLVSQHQDLNGFMSHIEEARKNNKSSPSVMGDVHK